MEILNLIGGDSGIWSTLLFFAFIIFYPKLMILQMTWKLESDLRELEGYKNKAEQAVLKKIGPMDKKKKEAVENFMNFFVSTPVDIDPAGILRKLEHLMNESERRFEYFVERVAPSNYTEEQKANLRFGLVGALGVTQIYKILRHYVLTIKKTNNLQLAMILQMTMPMLMKMAKANVKATQAFVNGVPIGDAIGPMVAAHFKTKKGTEIAKDVVLSEEKVGGKKVYVMKATGPKSALGKLGKAVEAAHKKYKIDHVITVDAAGKMEGEETGSVAEGVGVMMGGIGVEKSQIEAVVVDNDLPIDGVVIKMSPTEASIPLNKKVYNALPEAVARVENLVKETKSKKVLIIGVGNTCGVGDVKESLKSIAPKLEPMWKKHEEKMKGKKKEQDDEGDDENGKKKWWDWSS
jgi:hypothetical protein